jgi:hypothetical protein
MESSDDDDNFQDEDSVDSGRDDKDAHMTPGDKLRRGIRKIMHMNLFGGFLDLVSEQKANVGKAAYVPQRKRGAANVYSLSEDKPEFNKFVTDLNKGIDPSTVPAAATTVIKDSTEESDSSVVNAPKKMRCTDSILVKNAFNKKPESTSTEPEVDVDIMIDIMKELQVAKLQDRKPQQKTRRKSSVLNPPLKQSMAILSFKQQSKASKLTRRSSLLRPLDTATAKNTVGNIDNNDDLDDDIGGVSMVFNTPF